MELLTAVEWRSGAAGGRRSAPCMLRLAAGIRQQALDMPRSGVKGKQQQAAAAAKAAKAAAAAAEAAADAEEEWETDREEQADKDYCGSYGEDTDEEADSSDEEDMAVAQQQRVERSITTRYGRRATVVLNRGATSSSTSQQPWSRRAALLTAAAATAGFAAPPRPAAASKLPQAVDSLWEGLGGGPSDLLFPESFLGVWDVESVLTALETPLGPEMVPNMRVVQRAAQEDLNAAQRYQVAFVRNQRGEVVPDRSFNTASLMQAYTGTPAEEFQSRIAWDLDDPNQLEMSLPGGLQVSTRVTRRSLEAPDGDRLSTSEFFQQLIASPEGGQPKVKASQCYTKYKWRSEEAAALGGGGGVQIVATQVVSDYLTAFDDAQAMMAAQGRPVVVYTYRMAFRRPAAPGGGGAAGGARATAAAPAVATL
ncbi:hypothetical protein C2E20_7188 isoform B [Micractinium conductrix]|uniref:DUF6816 domain-containing protein n=1 Tax=Micractinium conductrix TaxID=554055 RepID=A0A2P6V580_9CHLO|nr:hypothetical protein C2E20_7188 isoform A [Micractinium conductrix]PSC69240.1 hypothetical protein C2E20_7188 isoform B [Micractinium conductrix]|eukprot:PSC69239.1 hypothetical protein C2E20_7188 isoform A [Micractinium conductrix]